MDNIIHGVEDRQNGVFYREKLSCLKQNKLVGNYFSYALANFPSSPAWWGALVWNMHSVLVELHYYFCGFYFRYFLIYSRVIKITVSL